MMLKQREPIITATARPGRKGREARLRLLGDALCLGGGVMIGVDFLLLPLSSIVLVALLFGMIIGCLGLLLCGLAGWRDL